MINLLKRFDIFFVVLWGTLLFIPFLGVVHLFDWDEINFAESAREMIVTGNYQKVQINYQPFMEKPPLFFWIQVLSMKVFGVGEFAARFPNAIIGIITLVFIFTIGKKLYGRQLAFLWVLFITGSFTPHLYFKSGIIDPLYNLFIFAAVYMLYLYSLSKQTIQAVWLGLFTGLAIITKGPVAVLVVMLCFITLWALKKFNRFFSYKDIFITALVAFLVSAVWFGFETMERGTVFLSEFLKYQLDLFLNPVAGHGQPFWYHPLVLLVGCFPASVIALKFIFKTHETANKEQTDFFRIMQIMFWAVLILFSIVETKIVHYSSLCYLPLTFMAAMFIHQRFEAGVKFSNFQTALLLFTGIFISFIFIALPLTDYLKPYFIPYIKDDFAVAALMESGNWNGYEWIPGVLLFITVIITSLFIFKNKVKEGIFILLVFISLFIPLVLKMIVPKIESYSQGVAISFFESKQQTDCYIETLGYKSYAQYFYARTLPAVNTKAYQINWLLTDSIDKDAYFVLHVNNIKDHINSSMIEIGRKGGFVFYKRKALR
ncbi:MAG: glycosyltransferase family 39 protein [Bacteroidia bacterium]|nr:glycosyltransferase family 39 protein [Bacteroidia bacterium]